MSQVAIIEGQMALPAHLQAAFGTPAVNNDLSAGVSAGYPVISYKGKTWAVNHAGERTVITNDRGEPAYSIDVVILKANPNISKVWYKDSFQEGSDARPDCYSNDGITPALDAPLRGGGDPRITQCAVCPKNQFGSRITENGAKGKDCADARRLAVAPEGDMENAMLLRVPAASLRELRQYAETLTKRGVPYSAVVTNVSFDREVAYPKLQFKPVRFLDADEAALVLDVQQRDVVDSITLRDNPVLAEIPQTGHSAAVDALGAMPAHLQPMAGQATTQAAPVQQAQQAVTPAEVAQVMTAAETAPATAPDAGAAKASKAASGFGGKRAKADAAPAAQHEQPQPQQPQPAAPPADTVTVLAANAVQGLDAALATLDD